ncbi:Replication termination factor 2 [Lecanora helva]
MGNDGGSIPTRRELVKEAARDLSTTQVKEIQTEKQEHYWSTCALSHEPLKPPIVSDAFGTLYNRYAVLEYLIAPKEGRQHGPDTRPKAETFKNMRDTVEVKFETSPQDSKWLCPITGKKLGPGVKAVYLVPCGHVFAESALKEMPDDPCFQCNTIFNANDIIPILPVDEAEKDRLRRRIQDLKEKGVTHSLKKAPVKKRKTENDGYDRGPPIALKRKHDGDDTEKPESKINNQDTASLTARVLAEQAERDKRRKTGANDNVKSLFSKKDGKTEKQGAFMTRGYTIL